MTLFGEPASDPDAGAGAAGRFVEVAVKLPLRTEFTYRVPDGIEMPRIGNRVRVPFRGKTMPGVVTALPETIAFDPKKVREIEGVVDAGLVLPPAVLALARRLAHDYGCSLGEALDATLPAAAKRSAVRRIPHAELAIPVTAADELIAELEDKHQQRARVVRTLLEFGAALPISELRRRTGTSDSPWKTLARDGVIRRVLVAEEAKEWQIPAGMEAVRHDLNEHQQFAVDAMEAAIEAGQPVTFLLHGVTGSGKTEVYLRALEATLAAGKTGIVLVPEISLTPQTVGRFASRFPDIAVLHSRLTDAERGRQWRRLLEGTATVAIGARSALFAPLQNVGLIVLDEEHESSFKQDSSPRYHARELACVRGEIENAVVVLGSATPTLESYGRAKRGVYRMLELPVRAGAGRLPRVIVEDLRGSAKIERHEGVLISRTLQVLMEERLKARDQVLLFLNRRGFAPVLICPSCGTGVKCEHCDVSMTYHRRRGRLVCHYCMAEMRRPELCGHCDSPSLHELGVGTERVAAAVHKLFPDAVIARMDADTMVERDAFERVLTAFRQRQIDVLIGTQMVAKGHDFPDLTLVGVISADTGLFLPDFRAAERSFQLLYQVAGRAGRAKKEGIVVFQTLCPENYAVQAAAAHDYESFVQQELQYRKALGYPPFSRLVRILFESREERTAKDAAREVAASLPKVEGLQVLGPAPAIVPRIKERHRCHLVLKCRTGESFDVTLEALQSVEDRTNHKLRVTLDVDPQSLL